MCESCANRRDQCPVLLSSGSLADLSHCETQSLLTCEEKHPLTTCTDVNRKCEKDTLGTTHEVPNQVQSCVQSCRIIIHKRQKHVRLLRIESPITSNRDTCTRLSKVQENLFSQPDIACNRPAPLMSLALKPPPIYILKKLWKLLRVPNYKSKLLQQAFPVASCPQYNPMSTNVEEIYNFPMPTSNPYMAALCTQFIAQNPASRKTTTPSSDR